MLKDILDKTILKEDVAIQVWPILLHCIYPASPHTALLALSTIAALSHKKKPN